MNRRLLRDWRHSPFRETNVHPRALFASGMWCLDLVGVRAARLELIELEVIPRHLVRSPILVRIALIG